VENHITLIRPVRVRGENFPSLEERTAVIDVIDRRYSWQLLFEEVPTDCRTRHPAL